MARQQSMYTGEMANPTICEAVKTALRCCVPPEAGMTTAATPVVPTSASTLWVSVFVCLLTVC